MLSVNSHEMLRTIHGVQIEQISDIKDQRLHLMIIFQKQKCNFYIFCHLSIPSTPQSSLVSQRLSQQYEAVQILQRRLNNVMVQYGTCEQHDQFLCVPEYKWFSRNPYRQLSFLLGRILGRIRKYEDISQRYLHGLLLFYLQIIFKLLKRSKTTIKPLPNTFFFHSPPPFNY